VRERKKLKEKKIFCSASSWSSEGRGWKEKKRNRRERCQLDGREGERGRDISAREREEERRKIDFNQFHFSL
jgi:hypothetical protein